MIRPIYIGILILATISIGSLSSPKMTANLADAVTYSSAPQNNPFITQITALQYAQSSNSGNMEPSSMTFPFSSMQEQQKWTDDWNQSWSDLGFSST